MIKFGQTFETRSAERLEALRAYEAGERRGFVRLLQALLMLIAAVIAYVLAFTTPEHFTLISACGIGMIGLAIAYLIFWEKGL